LQLRNHHIIMKKKNLYATLIGINAYPQNPLGGCVNDALAMDEFLRSLCLQQEKDSMNRQGMIYHPLYLLAPAHPDQQRLSEHQSKNPHFMADQILEPSFQNVTTKAFEHLKQAKDGDICLLYYSGHGSTIEAPKEFAGNKSSLQNETIVCLDSRSVARDLIDKEIAFLLWDTLKGKNVHCLVIMDCCFAGNNTRAIQEDKGIRYRHTSASRNNIPFSSYLGHDQGFYTRQPDGTVAPKIGQYVQLAASMDNETAQETNSGGLFTSNLLEVLRKGGSARSYRELLQTTRASVRNRNPRQHPVAFSAKDQDLDQPFLGGGILPYRPSFEVRFDKETFQWKLFGGAMDGLESSPDNPTKVKILGTDKVFNIAEVHAGHSYLQAAPDELDSNTGQGYRAAISKLARPRMEVCLSDGILGNPQQLAALQTAYDKGTEFPYLNLSFDKEKKDAPYQICWTDDDEYVLVHTGSTVPVFKREANASAFLTQADVVGKWLVVSDLNNSNSMFSIEDFVFLLERIEGETINRKNLDRIEGEIVNKDGKLPEEVVFKYVNEKQPAFRLSIALSKDSRLASCHVGAMYLESKYGIKTDLIQPDASLLVRGGAPISLKFSLADMEYSTIPLSIDKKYYLYGINEIVSMLKIMVSTQPQQLDKYRQDNLELDDQPSVAYRSSKSLRSDLAFEEDASDLPDWCVFTSRFRLVGPNKHCALHSGSVANLGAFEVEVPEGFEALAYAATGDDVSRKLDLLKQQRSIGTARAFAPPSGLFGNANTLDQAFPAGHCAAADNSVQVLELSPVAKGVRVELPAGKTLKIRPKTAPAASNGLEAIVPFGYDEESGLYYPIGYSDGEGVVHIEQLPAPSEGQLERAGDINERSLGGSIKLFFQKVVWSRLSGAREYNRLSLHQRAEDGNIRSTDYLGSARTKNQAKAIAEALQGGEALLLIHGIIGDTTEMVKVAFETEALYKPFAGVLSYDYENLNSGIEAAAANLKEMLQACGFGEEKRLTIVAHSMGGLVSRYFIEHLGGDRYVKKLIQCGTPNGGSEIADFRRKVTGWLFAGLNGISIFKPYMGVASFLGKRLEKGLFRTLDEMDPDSTFLAKLNASSKSSPKLPYYLVGGDTSRIELQFPEEASRLKKILEAVKSRGIYTGLDLAVFDKAPNDMAVKVERMKHLPWGAHERTEVLPCDHVSYFVDEKSLKKLEEWVG
jgi:pimeloyl-ACP methyl ester carboxylesterase